MLRRFNNLILVGLAFVSPAVVWAAPMSAKDCIDAPTRGCIVDLATGLINRMPRGSERATAMTDMVSALADGSDFARTINLLDRLSLQGQNIVRRRIVLSLTATGKFEEATRRAKDITDTKTRILALTHIAESLERNAAMVLLRRAQQDVADILGSDSYIVALGAIARAHANAGFIDEALQSTEAVPDRRRRAMLLVELADKFIAVPDTARRILQQANEQAASLSYFEGRVYPLEEIAKVFAMLGDMAAATRTLDQITNVYSQDRTRAEIAKVLARQQKFDEAIGLLRQIFHNDLRGDALAEIARAQARAGFIDLALINIAAIPPQAESQEPLADVAIIQSQTGDIAGALSTAARLLDITARDKALLEIAVGLAERGDRRRAEHVIDVIQKPARRVDAFVRMARLNGFNVTMLRRALVAANRISSAHERIVSLTQIAMAFPS